MTGTRYPAADDAASKPEPTTPEHRRLIATDTPGVYKRGSRYVAITRYKGKVTKSYHRTKSEAKAAKAGRDAGAKPTSRERFGVYVERWLIEHQGRTANGLAESTRADYALLMRDYVVPWFDQRGYKLGDVGPAVVKEFIAHLATLAPRHAQNGARRLSPATIRRIVTPLKAMLAEAYELELIPSDASRVRVVVQGQQRAAKPKTVDRDQRDRLLDELPDRHRLLFLFIANTGVRIGEALGAQWRDLEQTPDGPVFVVRRQFYRGKLTDRTKTAAGARSVALLPTLAHELTRHRATTPYAAEDDPIFPALTGGHLDDHNVRRAFRKAAKAAGMPWATPHVLRHSLATTLRDSGFDADVIAKVLGHTDEAFTRRVYIHTRNAPRFDALDGTLRIVAAD